MSMPIKPPGGPSAPDGPAEPSDADHTGSVDGSFRALVDDAAAVDAPAGGASVDSVGALGALEAELRAGRMTPDAAVDQLVQRAMASAAGLPEAHRASLEAQLREALDADPTLAALRKDLDGASGA